MPEIARTPGTPTTPDDAKKDRSGSDPFMTPRVSVLNVRLSASHRAGMILEN
jgi:hypothetical protein